MRSTRIIPKKIKRLFFALMLLLIPISTVIAYKKFPSALPNANESTTSTESISAVSANIKPPEYVIIRSGDETTFSSETTGTVISLPIKEGSSFQKGDVLLKLDCRLQQADLKKALAHQEETDQALRSAKKLKTYGTLSDFEFVKAKSDADGAIADVDKLKVTVEKCTILAPFSGGVSELKVHLYETVKPGDPLLKVVNTQNLTFEIQVPSQWLSWIKIGSQFHVYMNDINKTINARVTLINPEIEPISESVKIIGVASPADPSLRPGMTGQAIFPDNPEIKGK